MKDKIYEKYKWEETITIKDCNFDIKDHHLQHNISLKKAIKEAREEERKKTAEEIFKEIEEKIKELSSTRRMFAEGIAIAKKDKNYPPCYAFQDGVIRVSDEVKQLKKKYFGKNEKVEK